MNRTLALRTLGLGDLLTAVPALQALAAHWPERELVLLTTSPMAALGAHLPGVDRVVAVGEFDPLPLGLGGCELAVNLHGSGPESHRRLLDLAPQRLIAFAHQCVHPEGPTWDLAEHEVHRWCRLLEESGIPADPARLDVPPSGRDVPDIAHDAVVVHPGAKAAARRWPPDRFAEVAAMLHLQGHRVVVTGSPDEAALAAGVAADAGLPDEAVLAGGTDVVELVDVVGAASAVICGDTGVAHVATATGTPSVVLFGPTPPARWGPPTDRPQHVVLWRGTTGDPLADTPFPGLLAITVDDVLSAFEVVSPPRRSHG